MTGSPIGIVSAIVLGLLPSIVWLVFYLQADKKHPEPLRMIVYAFFLGGLATFMVLAIQIVFRFYILGNLLDPNHPFELLLFSAIEELAKFAAVFWFISKKLDFDEPMDAMIYMVIVALGFAAVENVASIAQVSSSTILGISAAAKLELLALRFLGATLLHSLMSAIVGYHWASAMGHPERSVKKGIAIGLLIAIFLHTVFNYLILTTGPLTWVISFVVFIGFFVMADFEVLKAEDI